MDHFMKQNEKAKDGPFYEANRKSKGWQIKGSRMRTQRMDHFMKQNETAKDGPFYEAKRKSKGWTIL